jgi:HEAT repeat protein
MATVEELRSLATSDPAGALEQLVALFLGEEYEPSRPIKTALIEWPDPETSARLAAAIDAWGTGHKIATAHALEVLGRRRDDAGRRTILAVASAQHPSRKGDPLLFREALFALGAFSTEDALSALRDGLRLPLANTEDQNRLDKVTAGIAELAEPAIAHQLLAECLTAGGDDPLTRRAIFVMGEAARMKRPVDARWSDAGLAFIRSSNASIKSAAVTLLAEVEHPQRTDRLLSLAEQGPLPQPLLTALGRTRDPRALPVLLRAMEPEEPVARSREESWRGMAAAAGLRHFGDPALVAKGARFVVGQLRDHASTWENGPAGVQFACQCLAALADKSVVDDVKSVLTDVEKRGAKKKDEKDFKERMKKALGDLLQKLAG